MEGLIGIQLQTLERGQSRLGTGRLGERNRTVHRHDSSRPQHIQLVVQSEDLLPVGLGGALCVAVNSVDRRLDLERAGFSALQQTPHERLPLLDLASPPQRPVLVGEQHE